MTFESLGRFYRPVRVSLVESLIAILTPAMALFLRGLDFNNTSIWGPVSIYCIAGSVAGVLALTYVRISKSPSGFVSTVDLIKTFKAALAASVAGVIATYFATHMQYIPRFVPVIHFFLFFGLITVLNIWRARDWIPVAKNRTLNGDASFRTERQLLLGCGPMSLHYAALIDELPNSGKAIVGIVSICGDLVGSTLGNRTILGPVENIKEIWSEFKNHGVDIQRIVIAAADQRYQQQALDAVSPLCDEHGIQVSLLTDLVGNMTHPAQFELDDRGLLGESENPGLIDPALRNSYLVRRQRFEWIFAILLVVLAAPLLVLVGLISYFDVGRPIIFWQQRVGKKGEMITVHKFRTLPHGGANGASTERRPSRIGRLLQVTRLDELPQLFDIVEGRLSFIGPRPLLPRDLPTDTGAREMVLPGVTGWAQVHGGKSITAEEKIALDDWYLRNASPAVDMVVIWKTLRVAILGQENRDDTVIADAVAEFHQSRIRKDMDHPDRMTVEAGEIMERRASDNDLVSNPTAA